MNNLKMNDLLDKCVEVKDLISMFVRELNVSELNDSEKECLDLLNEVYKACDNANYYIPKKLKF